MISDCKMKTKLLFLMTAVLMLATASAAKKVHTLGDSTMAPYDESATVTRGWGMYFGNFLTNGWTSINYAKGGRDSRGGYNELWQTAKKNVEAGDYVIITFGHNDEKNSGMDGVALYNYYKEKGDNTAAAAVDQRGTVPSTTYKGYTYYMLTCVPLLLHRLEDSPQWPSRPGRLVLCTDC